VVRIVIPPLRDRRGDIPLLAKHFLSRYAPPGTTLTEQALAALQASDWPGNVRQLEVVLREASARVSSSSPDMAPIIELGHLAVESLTHRSRAGKRGSPNRPASGAILPRGQPHRRRSRARHRPSDVLPVVARSRPGKCRSKPFVTFQRKLLLGFSLMALPALLVGAEAIRSNTLEHRALQALGESMARTRTYAELETAMFDQSEVIWRYLSGLDPDARKEFRLTSEVVDYWQQRWRGELHPDEMELADGVARIQQQIVLVSDSVFALYDAGQREAAYRLARRELKGRLLPLLTQTNREIYRRARESSVKGAYARLEEILSSEGRALLGILLIALAAGLLVSWLIARGLARPLQELTQAMAVVGSGSLDHPVNATSRDEIGDLARAFGRMTENLKAKIAQLEQTQAQLLQSEKLASIGEMSAAVAHGLRNPLASLRAAAQLVRRHPDSPSAQEHLDAIVGEVDRLDRRISHLLSFSRPAPFHPMPESVAHLIDEMLPAFAAPIRERGVELRVSVPPDLPAVRVDPVQLEQALMEVVSNALDAMSQGGQLSIEAHADNGASGRGEVTVAVNDTGGGIPPQVISSVTEPFFTTRAEGTGLGLAIAKRYIEQNGGRLEIESRVAVGTTVRVRLPAAGAGA
jgi:signal transduction histidine kinase